LERISIRSYGFATVGTVERPFPAKTYHHRFSGSGSVCHSRESGSKTQLGENPNISFLLHNGCPLEFIPCLTRDGHDNFLFKLSHYQEFCRRMTISTTDIILSRTDTGEYQNRFESL
jgi:hypothetical protein